MKDLEESIKKKDSDLTVLKGEEVKLQAAIRGLKKDIDGLKKEIQERDETIQDKVTREQQPQLTHASLCRKNESTS